MSEQPTESQVGAVEIEELSLQTARKPVSPLRRLGCIVGLVVWLGIMLIPCFFIALAVKPGQEIVLTQGSAPNQVLRFWLINEADHRGVGMSSASVHPGLQNAGVCVQTDVRFLLWVGESNPTSYCECYAPEGDKFEFTGASEGSCIP